MNTASHTLQISLLGNFSLKFAGKPLDKVNTPRLRSLLAYLLLHSSSLSRQQIAFSFWPDSSEKQARTNLRQLLHNLHRAFPQIDNFLISDNRSLRWLEDSNCVLDVAEFEKFVEEANDAEKQNEPAALAQALISAVDSYKGDLLPECYEEWIEPERERLHHQFITMLQRLVQVLETQRKYEKAIEYARKLVRLDDLNEFYYLSLMRLHMLNSDHTAALKVYHSCVEILDRELDVQPGAEIQKLFRKIKKMSEHGVLPGRSSSSGQPERIPLVGRHQEWEILQKIWQSVNDGSPQMVWIAGEAGIGKTHLAEELLEWVNRQGGTTASARFYAIERSLAFAPVAEWLRLDRFRTSLAALDDVWLKEIARILPELQIERKELEPPAPLAENWQRQRFFEAMARAVLAASPPILLFIDDLQWCDLETLGWLHYLLRFNSKAQLLIVCTVRPEELTDNKSLLSFMLDLRREGFLSQIELAPLDADNSFLLANKISGKELAADWTDWLFRESEGNPLFVVEMTRAGLGKEQGAHIHQVKSSVETHLPPRMQAVIYSRLVQLTPSARKLVDLAATIGRDFSIEVIKQACEQDEEDLIQALDELLRRGIIREQGNMAYYFSHKKISDVAYSFISEGQHRLLHRRVAGAIETVYADNREIVSSQLALHFEKANETEKAIEYYQMAGEASRLVYANGEAIEYLSKGLALVHHLSVPRAERDKMELSLLLLLAPCLVQSKGYGAKEVNSICDRVDSICKSLDISIHPPILRTFAIGKLVSGKITAAEQYGKELLKQARETDNTVVYVEAHYVLGVTYHWQGNFPEARRHLQQALKRYNPEYHKVHITEYAQEPSVICGIRLALVLWQMGCPHQSKIQAEKALSLSEKFDHPFSRAYALHWCAWLQNLRGDLGATLEHAQISMEFSQKYQFPYFATQSAVLYGWALFEKNRDEHGLEMMRTGLANFRATGSLVGIPYYRGLMALALATLGRQDQALTVLREALTALNSREERWPEAELYRIKGNILLLSKKSGNEKLTEHAFRTAMEIAENQEAKIFLLHTACNLKRFLEKQSRVDEANQLFNKICQDFKKGLSVKDREETEAFIKRWL